MKVNLLIITAALYLPHVAANIMCYTCVSTLDDRTCIDDPQKVALSSPITNCSMECCTVTRQEYIEDGSIASFSRSCQNNCEKDGVYKYPDPTFLTYFTYCRSPLCNEGDGTENPDGGQGDKSREIWGIKGKSSCAFVSPSISTLLLIMALLVLP
ncbi:uncharacterized protein [Palaemon carinicauda]|uniref:uncharacterized protein n=1 Tax=Palaemon carinicauda TaxID=392227 RepID=UPI0035B5C6CF